MISVSLHPRVLWCTRELLGLCLPLTHSLSPSPPLSIHNSLLLAPSPVPCLYHRARLSFLCILVVVQPRRCCRWVWPSFPLVDGTAVCRLRRIHGRRSARLLRCAEEQQQHHVSDNRGYVRLCVAACWTMVASVRPVCVCVCVCVCRLILGQSVSFPLLSVSRGWRSVALSLCGLCLSGIRRGDDFGLPPSSGAMVYEGTPRPLSPPHSLTHSLTPSVHSYLSLTRAVARAVSLPQSPPFIFVHFGGCPTVAVLPMAVAFLASCWWYRRVQASTKSRTPVCKTSPMR